MKRRGKNSDSFLSVAKILATNGYLVAKYRPHRLSGEWMGLWECHIEPDWLLIYDVNDLEVLLVRTGTHSYLFK
jgi:mRNA interferase YafQ